MVQGQHYSPLIALANQSGCNKECLNSSSRCSYNKKCPDGFSIHAPSKIMSILGKVGIGLVLAP